MRAVWLLVALLGCAGETEPTGALCDDAASLCGTLDSATLATPVRCAFGAIEVNEFRDPPVPEGVWDEGFNVFENIDVESLPYDFALNDLDFWDGQEMYVAVVCDSDGDQAYTASDAQGVYGGATASTATVPESGIDITL